MISKMNIINKLHQEFVVTYIKGIDFEKGSKSPLVVELDTTEACDLACPGCISEDLVANRGRFSNQRLLQLGKEFKEAGVKAVILIGGGEPLAHSAVGEFITYLGENDIRIGITTNGTMIDKYLNILAKYSFWTRISMDAATEKTFNKLRPSKNGISQFNHVIDNMRKLAQLKRGKLGFSFLIRTEVEGFGIESNIHEIYDAAVLAKNIGCDYFQVKPSYQYAGGIDHALVKHSPQRMEQARIEINRLDDLITDTFSIVKAINLDASLNGIQSPQIKSYTKCPVSELRTLVCPSGVFICPYWRGKERFRIGDVNNSSFAEMWNSKKRNDVMNFTNPSTKCGFHCLRHESNLEILKIVEELENKATLNTIDEYDRFI